MFTPEIWVLISFLCFVGFFGKKLYKTLAEQLDNYIADVTKKIEEAERIKEEAAELLKNACLRRDQQNEEIEMYKKQSEEKLQKLADANAKYIENLSLSFQRSFAKKVDADISKKVNMVRNNIIEQIVSHVEAKILQDKPKIRVSEDDLKKL